MMLRRFAAFGNLLLAALLMLVVWVLIVWVGSRPALKALIDMTPQATSSVDPATIELLRELREQRAQIEFHLVFPPTPGQPQSDAQRQELAIRARLRDLTRILLRLYQYHGGESVKVKDHDLYADPSGSREALQRFGVGAEGDVVVVAVQQSGREPRFRKLSLVDDLADIRMPEQGQAAGPIPRAQVPVLRAYQGEVALSSALKSLLVQGVPVAYFLNSCSVPYLDLANTAIGRAYGGFVEGLTRLGFEVRQLDLARERVVPRDAALVIVLEPVREFLDGEAQALFEYVRGGGRLFVDYHYSDLPDQNPDGGKLGELLGYEVGKQPVFHLIPDYGNRIGGPGLDGNDGVAKLQLALSPNHPITRRFVTAQRAFEVMGARELKERGSATTGIRREPLLITGPHGWLARPGADGRPDTRAPQVGRREFQVGMAIEVDPPAAPQDGSAGNASPPAGEPARPGQVVVIAGVFCNNYGLNAFGDLAYAICNWMAERRVMMAIGGSQYQVRHLELKPQQHERVWWLLVCGVPGAFLGLGLVVFFLRRRL
jgi:hypothetical protein